VTLPEVLAELQSLLWCWAGYCPICDRSLAEDQSAEEGQPTTDTG
jgi:hypothetical protein